MSQRSCRAPGAGVCTAISYRWTIISMQALATSSIFWFLRDEATATSVIQASISLAVTATFKRFAIVLQYAS
jgi:hypothetical protein